MIHCIRAEYRIYEALGVSEPDSIQRDLHLGPNHFILFLTTLFRACNPKRTGKIVSNESCIEPC